LSPGQGRWSARRGGHFNLGGGTERGQQGSDIRDDEDLSGKSIEHYAFYMRRFTIQLFPLWTKKTGKKKARWLRRRNKGRFNIPHSCRDLLSERRIRIGRRTGSAVERGKENTVP